MILKAEDFFADTTTTFKQVLTFLGLPDWEPSVYKRFNVGSYSKKMPDKTRQDLVEYFAPYNQRLYNYLGMDFGWDEAVPKRIMRLKGDPKFVASINIFVIFGMI